MTSDRMPRPYLTSRQRQCLRLAAAGLEYRQIAEHLGVRFGTVRVHLTSARKALGARNTAHAAALAVHYGIATADDLVPREDA